MEHITQYKDLITKLAAAYFPNPEDREDAAQEARIKLMQLTVPELENAQGWVYRVVSNLFKDIHNKNVRLRELDQYAAMDDGLDENSPEVHVENLQEEQELHIRISDLPAELEAMADMYYFKGLSYRDIAEEFDIPEGTVASRLNTVRRLLTGGG